MVLLFNLVITDISVVQRETTLSTDSIEKGPPVKTEIVRMVSLSTTEIIKITQFKKTDLQVLDTLIVDSLSNIQLNHVVEWSFTIQKSCPWQNILIHVSLHDLCRLK